MYENFLVILNKIKENLPKLTNDTYELPGFSVLES